MKPRKQIIGFRDLIGDDTLFYDYKHLLYVPIVDALWETFGCSAVRSLWDQLENKS